MTTYKLPKVLNKLHSSAEKAGLDKITDREIEVEISSYRKSNKQHDGQKNKTNCR